MKRRLILSAVALAAAAVGAGVAMTGKAGVKTAAAAEMEVYKSPLCGCCGAWVDHMRDAGFTVNVHDRDDLTPVKRLAGVPAGLASCHTALVDGYVLEGHVPADDVLRLLAERPDGAGLAVPGMPVGSPGMEMPDQPADPYDVLLFDRDGTSRVFSSHR